MQPKERLQIYLTNTLEPIEPQQNFLLPALSNEVKQAQELLRKKRFWSSPAIPPIPAIPENKGK